MPFVSEAQRKKCYVLYTKDIKEGRKPKWDCKEWENELKTQKSRTVKSKTKTKTKLKTKTKTKSKK